MSIFLCNPYYKSMEIDLELRLSIFHVYNKKQTIHKFLSKLNKSVETIYGFYETDDEQFIKTNNSQNFPKLKKSQISVVQKKKIVSFRCKNFLKNKNFQKPSFGIKLSDSEIFSLTSYHDFGLLEKILTAKKILVRVHASEKMGLGHVYNMLTMLCYASLCYASVRSLWYPSSKYFHALLCLCA